MLAMEMGFGRCCFGKQLPWFSSWNSRLSDAEIIHQLRSDVVGCYSERYLLSFGHLHFSSTIKNRRRQGFWRTCTMPVSLVESSLGLSEDYSKDGENASEDSAKKLLTQSLSSNELKSLLVDSEREKLIRKLSEANQQNRFLKRQALVLAGISMEGDDELLAEPEVKVPPKSDEWMTTLPPERKPSMTIQSTTFNKGTKEGRSDASIWTDSPLNRGQQEKEARLNMTQDRRTLN